MNRWFRVYDDVLDDPKVQRLSAENFRGMVNVWCLASKNDGRIPPPDEVAFKLRMSPKKATKLITDLETAGLVDADADGLTPHNWNARQFKSDSSTERVKRFRQQQRNVACNVSPSVTETAPESESETETESETEAEKEKNDSSLRLESAPAAPSTAVTVETPRSIYTDSRHELWGEAVPILGSLGIKEKQARQMIGKWLRDCRDDAHQVLSAIQRARDVRVIDPIPWITRALETNQGANHDNNRNRGGSTVEAGLKLQDAIAGGFELPPRPSGF
jgi:hypothetical protein